MSALWENWNLREARLIAADADTAWRTHKSECPRCARAARLRRLTEACPAGVRITADRSTAHAAVKREQELAKLPVPGQGTLFDLDQGAS
jgi:hypothetical protein